MSVSGGATTFEKWIRGRAISSYGTNSGSQPLPFQRWRRFKEAFAPELVAAAVRQNPVPVTHCVDPFGGSGTTALACQFLGVEPTTIEVNPFLADLIGAKLASYDLDALAHDLGRVLRSSQHESPPADYLEGAPATMVQPGVKGRWIFDKPVADRIGAFISAINGLQERKHRRLLLVLLAGTLIDLSNVTTSGKGRRYRRNWQLRIRSAPEVDAAFRRAATGAMRELRQFSKRLCATYDVVLGDARLKAGHVRPFQLAVFSPPYPNSFDYTDVYNVELWVLGYLKGSDDNRALRNQTLSSHVQILRPYSPPPEGSPTLVSTLEQLRNSAERLWSPWIPHMLGAYFADIDLVLAALAQRILPDGRIWMIVGDSRYADIGVPTAQIASEVATAGGYQIVRREAVRSMRASPQQGGDASLDETLLVLSR